MLNHEAQHSVLNRTVSALVVAHDVCILTANCDAGEDLTLYFGPEINDVRFMVTLALALPY